MEKRIFVERNYRRLWVSESPRVGATLAVARQRKPLFALAHGEYVTRYCTGDRKGRPYAKR